MLPTVFVCLCFGSLAFASPDINLLKRQVRQAGTCGLTTVANKVRFAADGTPSTRIVGGIEARPHSIPWQVSFRNKTGGHFCGGSVIRVNDKGESDIILTAAHCFNYYSKPEDFDVYIGAHYKSKAQPGEQKIAPAKNGINKHENYVSTAHHDDVAIVKLEKPVKFTDNIKPVCLAAKNDNLPVGTYGIVSGWGDLFFGSGKGSETLQQVVVPITEPADCKIAYGHLDDGMLCAGYAKGGKDSCQDDSGGPLFFKKDQGYVLHGVVSHGDGCAAAGKDGVYARVSYFIDWIQDKTKELTSVE
jgi:secreted trypsin-like serine protease